MKTTNIIAAAALSLSAMASSAFAGPMDLVTTGCEKNFTKRFVTYSNCFTGYEPYATGHYAALKCADAYKGLRYTTVKTFWKGEQVVLRCTAN